MEYYCFSSIFVAEMHNSVFQYGLLMPFILEYNEVSTRF